MSGSDISSVFDGLIYAVVILLLIAIIIGAALGYGCAKITSKYKLKVGIESVTNNPSIK